MSSSTMISSTSTPLLRPNSFDLVNKLPEEQRQKKSVATSLRRSSSASSTTSSSYYTSSSSSSSITSLNNTNNVDKKYSYRTCPMCSERLLVRIHGAFVHKWINLHFANRHHEWMHVVVNLH